MLIHTDAHLNIFWMYGGVNYLENNVTKALINTFESLDDTKVVEVLKNLNVLPESTHSVNRIDYQLQKKPDKGLIEKFPDEGKVLWGISPTGRAWSQNDIQIEKLNFDNESESINLIMANLTENVDDKSAKAEAIRQFDTIKEIHDNRGDSIPDGWIMIYKDDTPLYCIAVENKWYNLNPYQLRNHWEKSLLKNDGITKFSRYEDIYRQIRVYKDEIVPAHFLEYISLLGCEPSTEFYAEDFAMTSEKFYQDILNRKFYRYLERFMVDFAKKNSMEYDIVNQRLYIPEIDHLNVFFDFNSHNGVLSISTEIGVDKEWVNRKLFPLLHQSPSIRKTIENIYPSGYYVRYIRLNNRSKSLYFWIQHYSTLDDYLSSIDIEKIAISKYSKINCYKELQALGVPSDNIGMQQLHGWEFKDWHWLEYLRIIQDVDVKKYCGNDTKFLDICLTKIIEQQEKGIRELHKLLVAK